MSGDQARGGDGRFVAVAEDVVKTEREENAQDDGVGGGAGPAGPLVVDVVPRPTAEEKLQWDVDREEFRAGVAEQLAKLVSDQRELRGDLEGLGLEMKGLAGQFGGVLGVLGELHGRMSFMMSFTKATEQPIPWIINK